MKIESKIILALMTLLTPACSEIGSCGQYASKYSCSYVIDRANYDVYYWNDVASDNPDNEKIIGTVKGLAACKNAAAEHAAAIGEDWNDRSYICALVKDGGYAEKHRLL